MHRTKRLPDLDKILVRSSSRRGEQQSWEEQLQIMQVWSAQVNRAIAIRKKL